MLLEKQRLEEIKTYKESQKEALKQELSLRQRKYQMEDKLQKLQGDVATLEGKLLASGKKPSKHSMYDVSDIDSKYQEQAKKNGVNGTCIWKCPNLSSSTCPKWHSTSNARLTASSCAGSTTKATKY